MFTWLGTKLAAILSTYVLGVVSSLMTAIAPLALTAMTIWVLLYGWAVLRHEVSESVPTFAWKTPAGCWSGSAAPARCSSLAATPTALPPEGAFPRPPTSTPPSPYSGSTAGSAGSTPTRPAPGEAGRLPHGSWSTLCTRRQNLHNLQNLTRRPVL